MLVEIEIREVGEMHLDYIRSFCLVVNVKSITKAAAQLHLSQPALSLQINSLENKFGTKLLERSNRGVKPTQSGMLLYRHGQQIIKIMDALHQDITVLDNPAGKRLKIASSPVPGSYLLPVKMLDFTAIHPESKYRVSIRLVQEVFENLLAETANIGIVSGPIPLGITAYLLKEDIFIHPLGSSTIVPICHKNSPWAGKKIGMELLYKLPLILPKKFCGSRTAIELGLQDALDPTRINILAELDDCAAIISAVKTQAGVGLVPRLAIDTRDVEVMDCAGLEIPLPFTLLASSTLEKTPALKDMITLLKSAVEQTVPA